MEPETEVETNQDQADQPDAGVNTERDLRDIHPDDRDTAEAEDTVEDSADEAEDEDEIDHNGRKYRLPKSLINERMMHQDYTRKTTELAEARRNFEQERIRAVQVEESLREDYGRVHALKAQYEAYNGIDWQALNAADPVEAQALWIQREQIKETLGEVEGSLQQRVQERLQSQQQDVAKAMQETGQVLARDIKGFNPQIANEIAQYGITQFGVSPQEVSQMADPRLWKVLHRAMSAERELAKVKAGRNQEKLASVTPAATVKGRAAPTVGLDDRLSSAEWQRRRNEQLAKRKR